MRNNYPILIILAGGKSSRMGSPKGLLSFKEDYWLLHQIESFTTGESVIIGLGHNYQLYFDAIPWLENAIENQQEYKGKKVQVVINLTPEFGLFSTLQTVLKTLNTTSQSDFSLTDSDILVLPIDVPLVNTSTLEKIIKTANIVVIPNFYQKNGHPVKLAPQFWKKLLHIDVKDQEARLDIQIKKLPLANISAIDVIDKNCIKNLNTPENWSAFIRELR